jgi:hypothetical protein
MHIQPGGNVLGDQHGGGQEVHGGLEVRQLVATRAR